MKNNKNQSESLLKKILRSQATSVISFSLAAVLLLFGGIGGARAAFIDQSDIYRSQVGMEDIGVSLLENGTIVASRDYNNQEKNGTWSTTKLDLLSGLPATVIPGVSYKEELSVQNTRTINEYVRVTIYKYWLDPSGKKTTDLSPDLIHLNLINVDDNNNNWHRDSTSQTKERTVLYYQKLLPSGEKTPFFADKVSVDGSIATMLNRSEASTDTGKTITHTYKYEGYQFCLEVTVDAVQENNASKAAVSSWGDIDSGNPWPAE